MSTPVGLLDFFILEGSEYVERLDGLLAGAGGNAPDAIPFAQAARALRGSATMAKLAGMADLAGAVERVARGLRDGLVPWTPALRGALVAAVDDCKLLLRAVRSWSDAEEQRAAARTAELMQYVPALRATPTPQAVGSVTFLAAETEQVAQAIDAFMARPTAADALAAMLDRVRALRGIAALRDLPPLAEVVDALERAAKPLELAAAPAPLAPQSLALFTAASALLHRASHEIRAQGRPDPASQPAQRFVAAAAALDATDATSDRIVPVASLYYADEGPHVVSRAPNPPTTPAERFRLEVVSQAEHLRRLVSEARASAADPAARSRLARELRHALRALGDAALGFGEREVADFVTHVAEDATSFDARALGALDEIATLLADARTRQSELARRLEELGRAGGAPPAAPRTPARAGTPATSTPASGKELKALLQSSLAGMAQMVADPMSAGLASPTAEERVVPIETLLYRGPAALARARELRDALRRSGGAPDVDSLAELFDLLDLAATE